MNSSNSELTSGKLFPLHRPSTRGGDARTVLAGKDSPRRAAARPCLLRSVPPDFDLRRAAPAGTSLGLWRSSSVEQRNVHSGGLLMEVADNPDMYGPPPNCKRKMRGTGLVCAHVYGLDWSEKSPGQDGMRYALFPFRTAVLEDYVRMRVLRAPDLTVVPSHGSPANLAGNHKNLRRRQAAAGSGAR